MKVVINKQFGGFGLSAFATKEIAKRKGEECYFFKLERYDVLNSKYIPITVEEANSELLFYAFKVSNPNDYDINKRDEDGTYKKSNEIYKSISNSYRDSDRTDPDLIAVVEQLGEKANTRFSKLVIVEIPDDTEYKIDDYDGMESIHETHRVWG